MTAGRAHFVRYLHHSIMHRLVEVSWCQVKKDVENVKDVQHLHMTYLSYVRNLCSCCLISSENPQSVSPVLHAVLEILSNSLRYAVVSNEMIVPVAAMLNDTSSNLHFCFEKDEWQQLLDLDSKFENAKQFLRKLLDKPNLYNKSTKEFLESLHF
mmetsp:Transcript_16406/g.21550  ORF Transcript_16406/g.21550 Transcript_16406/m.21550 type:complete len:155 (-) Transcript_16406:188-652(-)